MKRYKNVLINISFFIPSIKKGIPKKIKYGNLINERIDKIIKKCWYLFLLRKYKLVAKKHPNITDKFPVNKTETDIPPKHIKKMKKNLLLILKILKKISGIKKKDKNKKNNQNFKTNTYSKLDMNLKKLKTIGGLKKGTWCNFNHSS